MSRKFLFLLFLVLFNFFSTALADSHHVVSSNSEIHAELTDHSHDGTSGEEAEHCDDDSCHTGHYHHFLQTTFFFGFSSIQFALTYSDSTEYFPSLSLDIIKPPLLDS